MRAYLLRRMVGFVINLILVSFFVFALLRMVPGDAAANILGQDATPENLVKFREEHGLNGSLVEQYTRWAGGILTGDFGKSLWSHTSVTSEFLHRLPITLEIVALSFSFTLILGIAAGITSALRQPRPGTRKPPSLRLPEHWRFDRTTCRPGFVARRRS